MCRPTRGSWQRGHDLHMRSSRLGPADRPGGRRNEPDPVGSDAVRTGHWTPLAIVDPFGTLDALHPGRIDLRARRFGLVVDAATGSQATQPRDGLAQLSVSPSGAVP